MPRAPISGDHFTQQNFGEHNFSQKNSKLIREISRAKKREARTKSFAPRGSQFSEAAYQALVMPYPALVVGKNEFTFC